MPNIWPSVREQQPHLRFTVVGRDPAPAIQQLANLPGVDVTGSVTDVRPFYRDACVAVVPLRVGGGSRLKILEAMAAGVPVVSTTLGAEGIDVQDGENIVLADSDDEFAAAIIKLSLETQLRERIIESARRLARRYDWSQIGTKLFEFYRRLVAERS